MTLVAIPAVMLGVCVGLQDNPFVQDRVTLSNFSKITDGMTEADVNRILGRYLRRTKDIPGIPIDKQDSVAWVEIWVGKKATIHMGFDATGTVIWRRVYTEPVNTNWPW
jgi:hypothetical protein